MTNNPWDEYRTAAYLILKERLPDIKESKLEQIARELSETAEKISKGDQIAKMSGIPYGGAILDTPLNNYLRSKYNVAKGEATKIMKSVMRELRGIDPTFKEHIEKNARSRGTIEGRVTSIEDCSMTVGALVYAMKTHPDKHYGISSKGEQLLFDTVTSPAVNAQLSKLGYASYVREPNA